MLARLTVSIRTAVSKAAKTAALGCVAVIALLVGLGFLTLAFWLFLVSVTTPVKAALVLGGLYVGISMIVLAVMSIARRPRHVAAPAVPLTATPTAEVLPELFVAFMAGMSAGRKAGS